MVCQTEQYIMIYPEAVKINMKLLRKPLRGNVLKSPVIP